MMKDARQSLREILPFIAVLVAISLACVVEDQEQESFERPAGAYDVVPDDILDRMVEAGHPVYGGDDPPELEGVYEIRNGSVVYDERWPDHTSGWCDSTRTFISTEDPEVYLSDQVLEGGCSGTTEGDAFYVSGRDNCFSLYTREQGDFEGCERDLIRVLSGCLEDGGIDDYRQAQIAMSMEGDPCDDFVSERRINGVDYLRLFQTNFAQRVE